MREILLPAIAVAAVAVALAVLAGTHRVLARMAVRNASVQRGIPFDGMAPALQKAMPVRNGLTGSQAITVMGLDDAYESGFGGLVDSAGGAVGVASLPPDAVLVNEAAARDLNASAGDHLLLFWGNTVNEVKNVTVRDVVQD